MLPQAEVKLLQGAEVENRVLFYEEKSSVLFTMWNF